MPLKIWLQASVSLHYLQNGDTTSLLHRSVARINMLKTKRCSNTVVMEALQVVKGMDR